MKVKGACLPAQQGAQVVDIKLQLLKASSAESLESYALH